MGRPPRGKLLHEYTQKQLDGKGVLTIALSPDGTKLAGALADRVRVWDTHSHKALKEFTPPETSCNCLRFSADGKELIGIRQYKPEVIHWSATTGEELRRLGNTDEHIPFRKQALSPDGKTFARGDHGGEFLVSDLATGKDLPGTARLPKLHGARWVGPDVIGMHGGDGEVFFWDRKDGRLLRKHQLPGVGNLGRMGAVSPDGKLFAACVDGSIVLYDLATQKARRRFGNFEDLEEASFSPDGKALVAVDRKHGVTVWDVATGRLQRDYPGQGALRAAFSPDMRTVVFDQGASVYFAELASGKIRQKVSMPSNAKASGADLLRFSGDSRFLVAFRWYDVCVYSLRQGRVIFQQHTPEDAGGQSVGELSPDGRWLACSDRGHNDNRILLYDLENPQAAAQFKTLEGHSLGITSITFSPDGKYLVSASNDGTALVWDMRYLAAVMKFAKPDRAGADAYWTALGEDDAEKAGRAMAALQQFPDATLSLLKARLRPIAAPSAERIQRLIADLDSELFAVRDKANRELELLAELAEPALRQALKSKPALEVVRRIERLLNRLEEPVSDPEQLRRLRAVEVLERISTPEAIDLLKSLAKGAPAARLTKDAKASLGRLTPRSNE